MSKRRRSTKEMAALADAARDVDRARAQLATARRNLARHSRVGISPTTVLSGEWQRADKILNARRASLAARPEVVGVGLGHRHRSGFEHGEVCVVVFVEKKLAREELLESKIKPLPTRVRVKGDSIAIDVVELGPGKPHGAGDVIASIGNMESDPTAGTIGALALDLTTNEQVLLTAMHVTDGESRMTVPSMRDSLSIASNGRVTGGFTQEVDAAKVRMDDMQAVDPFLPPGIVWGLATRIE